MDKYGIDINPHIKRIPEVEERLLRLFKKRYADLVLQAASDTTNQHNLCFVLDDTSETITPHGGTVNYCKKTRKFDFIQYTVKRYGKRFEIK